MVLAKCHSQSVVRELALSFGAIPSFPEVKKNKMRIQRAAVQSLVKEKIKKPEDLIIYIDGRFGEYAGASFVKISKVDKLLIDTLKPNPEKS